jgi:hypothetical protein
VDLIGRLSTLNHDIYIAADRVSHARTSLRCNESEFYSESCTIPGGTNNSDSIFVLIGQCPVEYQFNAYLLYLFHMSLNYFTHTYAKYAAVRVCSYRSRKIVQNVVRE